MSSFYIVWAIGFEFQQMQDLLHTLDTMLEDYEQKLEYAYDENDLVDMDEDEEERYEKYLDIYASVLGDFPRRLYSSFLVSWFSIVEERLLQLCEDLDLSVTVHIKDRVRFDTGIHRARKYLSKAANYTIDNKQWQELLYIVNI